VPLDEKAQLKKQSLRIRAASTSQNKAKAFQKKEFLLPISISMPGVYRKLRKQTIASGRDGLRGTN
jgi:hypothetical protein